MSTPARIPAENLTGARLAVRLAALALLTGLLVSISLAAPRDLGRVAPIWPANAVVLICVLRARISLSASFFRWSTSSLAARIISFFCSSAFRVASSSSRWAYCSVLPIFFSDSFLR